MEAAKLAELQDEIDRIGPDGLNISQRAALRARRSEADWQLMVRGDAGTVHFQGTPGFTCRFAPAHEYDGDAGSQDLTIADGRHNRVFYDFRWQDETPEGDTLADLARRLARIVQTEVKGGGLADHLEEKRHPKNCHCRACPGNPWLDHATACDCAASAAHSSVDALRRHGSPEQVRR